MKTVLFICVCVVAALGAPAEEVAVARAAPADEVAVARAAQADKVAEARAAPALEHTHETDELGQYTLKYVTAEGTIVSEKGRLVATADGKDKVLVHEGEFTFVGDDGKVYVTKYKTSASGGYEVEGDHLPKIVKHKTIPEELKKEEIVASAS